MKIPAIFIAQTSLAVIPFVLGIVSLVILIFLRFFKMTINQNEEKKEQEESRVE